MQVDDEHRDQSSDELAPLDAEHLETCNDWWDCLTDDDRARLTAPRPKKVPCFFCRGRNVHSELCKAQKRSWAELSWGKHQGRKLTDIPERYLAFLLANSLHPREDREMILRELQARSSKYRTTEWEKLAQCESTLHRESNRQSKLPSNIRRIKQALKTCNPCLLENWVDESPKDGCIRTHCDKCGKFAGHRPSNVGKCVLPRLIDSDPESFG